MGGKCFAHVVTGLPAVEMPVLAGCSNPSLPPWFTGGVTHTNANCKPVARPLNLSGEAASSLI